MKQIRAYIIVIVFAIITSSPILSNSLVVIPGLIAFFIAS